MLESLRRGLKLHKERQKIVRQDGRTRIFGYDRYLRQIAPKRALLSYLVQPIIDQFNGRSTVRFSNDGLGLSWAQVLNELGFEVDIINWDDDNFVPHAQYDLVVWHGGKNFHQIFPALTGKTRMIHFLTGSYWKFNNDQEDARLNDLERRHGRQLPRDRYIEAEEDSVNQASGGIIVLGDPSMRDTFPKQLRVLTVNNGSYPDNYFTQIKKDYGQTRSHFLFFAGSGNVHKGLDLLLDAFRDLPQHLHIMTRLEPEMREIYNEMWSRPNIHLVGEIEMRAPDYYHALDECAWVILPSCSEGQAGSVVECMNQGLIPIVSRETRLDTGNYGRILRDCSISNIQREIRELSALDAPRVRAMAEATRRQATTEHSPETVRRHLREAIQAILQPKTAPN